MVNYIVTFVLTPCLAFNRYKKLHKSRNNKFVNRKAILGILDKGMCSED
jgi:hypothetical protein